MSQLTDEQHTEILLVHGSAAKGHLVFKWGEVFDWVRLRWPEKLKCRDYQHVLKEYQIKPVDRGSDADEDMQLLLEIHRRYR